MSKRRKKKRSSKTKRWGIIFGIELVLILILIPVVFVYAKLSLIQTASASDVDKANIVINNDVDATTQKALKGYRNIAHIRRPDASDIEIITKIIDSIMRFMRIFIQYVRSAIRSPVSREPPTTIWAPNQLINSIHA